MQKYEKWLNANTHLLTNQLAIVIGGTGSIGKEIVDYLLYLKAKVVIGARNVNKAEAFKKQMLLKYPNAYIDVEYVDLSDLDSIDKFQLNIDSKYQKADIFINNSGVYHLPFSLSKDGYEIHFATNALGNYYLSKKIVFDLKLNSKMIFVSSLAANFTEIDFNDIQSLHTKNKMKIYGRTKQIMNLNVSGFKKELNDYSIDVNLVHPGVCATDLFKNSHSKLFMVTIYPLMRLVFHSPKKAALSIIKAIFVNTKENEWIGPRGLFHTSGYPKHLKLRKRNYELSKVEKIKDIMDGMIKVHNDKWYKEI